MGQPGSIPTAHMKVKGENRSTKLSSTLHRSAMVHTPIHPIHTAHTQVKKLTQNGPQT